MGDRQKRKMWKFFISYHREIRWLEQMAEEGWFLKNISFGVRYTFTKGEPKHMIYDVDRFNLPAKPTLEEIRHKEVFMEMAQQMGWQEVTHSEDLTYYFSKEYVEGDINELHNDPESRRYRAEKFRQFASEQAVRLLWMILLVCVADIIFLWLQTADGENFLSWFDWFTAIYSALVSAGVLFLWRLGIRYARELSMTRAEWENSIDSHTHKKVYRLILTIRGLDRFLEKQQQEGWILKDMTPISYSFEKSGAMQQVYTMDTKWLIAKRRKEKRQFSDRKDWLGLNNDWEIESVREAEQKGWTYVCALENRSIIYRGDKNQIQPLNSEKSDKSLRFVSLLGEFGVVLIVSAIIGGICGFLAGYLGL